MDAMIVTYAIYLLLSVMVTVWVARTLHDNGRAFLIDAFRGREDLADSVNHLLVVGFYLINLGFIALFMRGHGIETWVESMEAIAAKMGVVLLVLGAMHFFNLLVLSRFRRRAMAEPALGAPPVTASYTAADVTYAR